MNEEPRHRELSIQIEALLFALGRPLARTELCKLLSVSEAALEAGIAELGSLPQAPRGTTLVDDGTTLELRVAPAAADLVERVRKDEYTREVGKAGLEVLSAIVYRGPLTRAEVDFIRGVNSSQTLRTLSMRGLVRKVPHPGSNSFLYEPTTELLAELGVSRTQELPEYSAVRSKLAELEESYRQKESLLS